MKEYPNFYRQMKWLSQTYEERLRHFNNRVKAGEITGDQEQILKRDLACNLNHELDLLSMAIINGEHDVCEPEATE